MSSLFKKVDLHLHLDGSLSYPLVQNLIKKNGKDMSLEEIKFSLSVNPSCRNLREYLQCFDIPSMILQSSDALTYATYDLITRLEESGLVYAEIRFAPQLHTMNGMTQEQAVQSVLKALDMAHNNNLHIQLGVLLCMMVTGLPHANQTTAELAIAYKNKGVVGLDLAGAEGSVPMSSFESLFHLAYKADIPFTIHAGECGSYDNISKAISFGAKRIGHGCAAYLSEECMNLLRNEHIVIETCPSSNLQTRAVKDILHHPIKIFLEKGIAVTVNTDNMTVSNTTLEQEYALLKDAFGFSDEDFHTMNETSLKAAFLPNLRLT